MLEWNFTESERHAIDSAYRKMENDEESKAREAIMKAESEARIEEARKTQETARLALEQMAQKAIEQYERTLKDG